jgi:hypothetical protein
MAQVPFSMPEIKQYDSDYECIPDILYVSCEQHDKWLAQILYFVFVKLKRLHSRG